MENGKLDSSSDVYPTMNDGLQQAAEYMRTLQQRFQSSVWTPGKQRSRVFADAHPITAIFLGIFGALALVPVASYLIFMAFVLVSCVSVALALAIGFTLFVGFWAGVFLFFTLLLVLCFTCLATAAALGFYLFYRLIFHVQSEDGQGVRGWAYETKNRLVPSGVQQYADNAQKKAADYYATAKEQSLKLDQM
ncbi:hypothetical protein M408DRAFT_328449 [Serendipita vermifera MAFF 305830]|uniref:Uncharacterized protein n=1 Tax=Serendipita vermifera MAFF 305830 TaxID=933852 RepID=A0A0C2WV28_SERVB|nr:hypothetical protein M408DRAFT_328449 [Serendipita vermifera MAFF 305830]